MDFRPGYPLFGAFEVRGHRSCHGGDVASAIHLRADVVPETFRAEALAEALKPLVAGQRVLWAGANRGREVLPKELEAAGAQVEKLVVYQNRDASEVPAGEPANFWKPAKWIGSRSAVPPSPTIWPR